MFVRCQGVYRVARGKTRETTFETGGLIDLSKLSGTKRRCEWFLDNGNILITAGFFN